MKNNKGFALSGILYSLFLLIVSLILLLLILLAVSYKSLNNLLMEEKNDILSKTNTNNTVFEYGFSSSYQTFIAPREGEYVVEAWGASGGGNNEYKYRGGAGAYTRGSIYLKKGDTLYIYVGASGDRFKDSVPTGNFNRGGEGAFYGGGATDIRTVSGNYNDTVGLRNRIMVAGGGGGIGIGELPLSWSAAGAGGATSGYSAVAKISRTQFPNLRNFAGRGASQTSGGTAGATNGNATAGSFGLGGKGSLSVATKKGGGGGGGYYGGGGGTFYSTSEVYSLGGGGGSSFVAGNTGYNAVDAAGTHTGTPNHFSNYAFDNVTVIDGLRSVPSTSGTGYTIGNYGDGKVRISVKNSVAQERTTFDYTGGYQEFTVTRSGQYKIETWGAAGGDGRNKGTILQNHGKGAYASGTTYLEEGTTLYIYVGGQGGSATSSVNSGGVGGYNGGGNGGNDGVDGDSGGGGGGATDVRLTSGAWNNVTSLRSRIMVAAGGAGSSGTEVGGDGGAVNSIKLSITSNATQTSGGAFGNATNGGTIASGVGIAGGGGGGGYYGGIGGAALASDSNQNGGTGGSSFVSGCNSCNAITAAGLASGQPNHYSGYVFSDILINSGIIPSIGSDRHGYAIITYITPELPETGVKEGKTFEFDYTGNYQTFTIPKTGYYKAELWGTSPTSISANGAYTKGDIYLTEGTVIYIYVGEGLTLSGVESFNGSTARSGVVPGGGATDIRLTSGAWNNADSLRSRIMVAAGAGANSAGVTVMGQNFGGGLTGSAVTTAAATQTSGGAASSGGVAGTFGVGGAYAGGGYWGGGQNGTNTGNGGSSYISGHVGSVAVISSSSNSPKTGCANGTSNVDCSKHYSGKFFVNTAMVAGNALMPDPREGGEMTGNNIYNGYARLTYLGIGHSSSKKLDNVRYIKSCLNGNTVNEGNHWVELQAFVGGTNVALNKPVTGTSPIHPSSLAPYSSITNGSTATSPYASSLNPGKQCITVDLGTMQDLSQIKLWVYYGDGRIYYGNEVSVSPDNTAWTIVYEGSYGSTSAGKTIENTVSGYSSIIKLDNTRYIRSCSNGNSTNSGNHWVELEAFANGINVAFKKPVTGTVEAYPGYLYSRITDGIIDTAVYANATGSGKNCITVDLGSVFDLNYIKLWHYYADNRTYYDSTIEVSPNNTNWRTVHNGNYIQTSAGTKIVDVDYVSKNPLESIRYVKNCINGSNINGGNNWVELEAFANGVNVALNKPVIGTSAIHPSSLAPYSSITNGAVASSPYATSADQGNQCIIVDLRGFYDLSQIKLWHYYADGRKYYENTVEVSNDAMNWKRVMDEDYYETEDGKTITGGGYEAKRKLDEVRYIKNCITGNTTNTANHWNEIKAISGSTNVALNKPVTGSNPANASYPYSRITDGDSTQYAAPSSGSNVNQCVTVDLETTYNLNEVKIWHYHSDGRTYNDNVTMVSKDNINWKIVGTGPFVETSTGQSITETSNLNRVIDCKPAGATLKFELPNGYNVNLKQGDSMTVEFDIFPRAGGNFNTKDSTPFSYKNGSFYCSSGTCGLSTSDQTDKLGMVGTFPFPDATSKHVALVIYSGDAKTTNTDIYIQGVKQELTQIIGTPEYKLLTNYVSLCGNVNSSGSTTKKFDGTLSRVRIWRVRRTIEEINANKGISITNHPDLVWTSDY